MYLGTTLTLQKNTLFLNLANKLTELQNKYTNAWLIIAGDFNATPDNSLDRFSPRVIAQKSQNSDIIT